MAEKAKHAHGSRKNLDAAIANGIVNEYDVLFLSGEDEAPAMGWVNKNGEKIIIDPAAEVSKLETQVDEKLAKKADTESLTALETELATKVNAAEVDKKINTAVTDSVASAKSYTDGKVEAAINEHIVKKYEITGVPEGTLVKMSDSEIRVMCPVDAVFTKQSVGVGGDANSYYMTLKTYIYDDKAVGYVEHLGNQVDSEILTDLKTDEYGRRYQLTWLALAKYDETTGIWNYYGKNSTNEKYTGWDYQLDLYDANGVMIGSDCIRINLSNEQCHSTIEPYYVGGISKEIDTKIEEKITEINTGYEIIEF